MASNAQPSVSSLKAQWDDITVEYNCLKAIGEFDFAMPKHAISIVFAPHDRVTWSVDEGTPKTTALPAASVFIYSSRNFVWHKREHTSEYMNIMLDQKLLGRIATESGLSFTSVSFTLPAPLKLSQVLHPTATLPSDAWNGQRCC